jgi:hypothetical protein
MKFDEHNWQHQAVKAIESLPPELCDAVGYSRPRGEDFTITIACEAVDGRETQIKTIQLRGGRPKRSAFSVSRPGYVELLAPDDPEGLNSTWLPFSDAAEFRRTLQMQIASVIGEHA